MGTHDTHGRVASRREVPKGLTAKLEALGERREPGAGTGPAASRPQTVAEPAAGRPSLAPAAADDVRAEQPAPEPEPATADDEPSAALPAACAAGRAEMSSPPAMAVGAPALELDAAPAQGVAQRPVVTVVLPDSRPTRLSALRSRLGPRPARTHAAAACACALACALAVSVISAGDVQAISAPAHEDPPVVSDRPVVIAAKAATLASSHCRTASLSADDASVASRVARALDGSTIAPGASLSLRIAAGGDVAGDGASVVASALYACALESGLDVVERHAAMVVVPWAPAGLEAVVGPTVGDLVVANGGDAPVRLRAKVEGGAVTVSCVGSDPDGRSGGVTRELTSQVVDCLAYAASELYADPAAEGLADDDVIEFAIVESRLRTRRDGELVSDELLGIGTYRADAP